VHETVALQVVASFFGGDSIGIRRAGEAFKSVAQALVMRASTFRWGEHLVNGPEGKAGECALCGAVFSEILEDRGCSAVD
jgi:hypothetical protein